MRGLVVPSCHLRTNPLSGAFALPRGRSGWKRILRDCGLTSGRSIATEVRTKKRRNTARYLVNRLERRSTLM